MQQPSLAESTVSPGRIRGGVHDALPQDSAHKHVSGEAVYVDDIPAAEGQLYAAIGVSDNPHARLTRLDLQPVEDMDGVVAVLTANDIPGVNNITPTVGSEPVFARELVEYAGQPIFAVAAKSVEQARRAARKAITHYDDLDPIITVDQALEKQCYVLPSHTMKRGDSKTAIASAPHKISGNLRIGGQDHFYLEGQVALAIPQEDGDVLIHSSTQHPSEVQHTVAKVLNCPNNAVTVEVRRMGGGFGGKETQATLFACIAALLARETRMPVNLCMDRDDDMIVTGKRHDFLTEYEVGFDDDGRILGVDFSLASRCGISADLSGPVNDRAMFHSDNAYYLENVTINSHRCKTNTVSNTAFRGFGGPQGMMGIETVVDEIARHLNKDPLDVRKLNLYGVDGRDVTPYEMKVEDTNLSTIIRDLEQTSSYRERRKAVAEFNANSPLLKRGLALTPVKFGISFTLTHLNQGGALIHVYTDGSVHLNHGGTEMGQGVMTKVAQIVAEEFQIDIDHVKITSTNTGKVPNTSATAASASTDLNGKAAENAARTIKNRLIDFAAQHFETSAGEVSFRNNEVVVGKQTLPFAKLVKLAHQARISLSSTGFYSTPKIHYDREATRGRPFYYFACGAAVSEVVIDTLTGEHKLLRVDILHDVGKSINPAIDRGQIEGGFVQGMGWLTTEELCWDESGHLTTHAPSTYKIPVCSDVPEDFRVSLLEAANKEDVIYRSKAVGEPPLMLSLSVFFALKDAIASTNGHERSPRLDVPATPERVLMSIQELSHRHSDKI